MNRVCTMAVAFSLFLVIHVSHGVTTPLDFGTAACEKRITEASVNDIVREIFIKKAEALAQAGLLSSEFWAKNKGLDFAVCDNGGSYDTFVVYGKGVVFDYQMLGFLFAQSRALIVGRYISLENQFDIHEELVRQFVSQGPALEAGPLAIIEKAAIERGMSGEVLQKTLGEPEFARREQTLFLQAIYFLAMHERCHVALDHETRIEEMQNLSEVEKSIRNQDLELEADRCAIDIINSDEAQYKNSPISFFGILMTVATQSIIANQPNLRSERSHPSTRIRMAAATERILAHHPKTDPDTAERYMLTIKGTAAYFDMLLQKLASAQ